LELAILSIKNSLPEDREALFARVFLKILDQIIMLSDGSDQLGAMIFRQD
jgi:hypothetical protein